MRDKIKIGTVQVNNSFSGQNYLPLSLGFLVSYAEFHCKNFEDFEFLNPIYKRVPIKEAVELYKDCDIVAFSVYVWNNNISIYTDLKFIAFETSYIFYLINYYLK